jgi:hypothetical protein
VTALSASCRRISLHLRGTDKGGRVDVYEAVVEGLARRVREISWEERDSTSLFDERALQRLKVAGAVDSEMVVAVGG